MRVWDTEGCIEYLRTVQRSQKQSTYCENSGNAENSNLKFRYTFGETEQSDQQR